jgi:hypothetical protein
MEFVQPGCFKGSGVKVTVILYPPVLGKEKINGTVLPPPGMVVTAPVDTSVLVQAKVSEGTGEGPTIFADRKTRTVEGPLTHGGSVPA